VQHALRVAMVLWLIDNYESVYGLPSVDGLKKEIVNNHLAENYK